MAENNYADDLAFLKRYSDIVELFGEGESRLAVAPAYQGRVMTSSLAGEGGASFGWINRRFISEGKPSPVFNNYGGEDRFWLGPEAGQFGLWFAKGEPFDMAHWKTPPGFGSGPFGVASQGKTSIALEQEFEVTNYSGATFRCGLKRVISAVAGSQAAKLLGTAIDERIRMVGFESRNTLTSLGPGDWTTQGGLLSIWILGMFKPLSGGRVIVPFRAGSEKTFGPRATTDYFGPIPADRCRIADDCLSLTCDGKWRSKIGIAPARARNVLGSFDPDSSVLTIAQFNLPSDAANLPYVNSLWKIQDAPFAGDAVNSYNDGEETPGGGQLGPFYELETSSPAAELAEGGKIAHIHRTFHFAGPREAIGQLAKKILGVDPTIAP
jgi:hypothetical protein